MNSGLHHSLFACSNLNHETSYIWVKKKKDILKILPSSIFPRYPFQISFSIFVDTPCPSVVFLPLTTLCFFLKFLLFSLIIKVIGICRTIINVKKNWWKLLSYHRKTIINIFFRIFSMTICVFIKFEADCTFFNFNLTLYLEHFLMFLNSLHIFSSCIIQKDHNYFLL